MRNMEKIFNYEIVNNKPLNSNTYLMELKGPTSWIKPGKFLNIRVPSKFLRRPMSIYDWNSSTLKVLYRLVGSGTQILSTLKPKEKLEVLIDLGNSYEPSKEKKQLIVCGGCGIGSVYSLAKQLTKNKIDVSLVIGFKNKKDMFLLPEWKKVCKQLIVCTDDGSYGFKGNVVDAIKKHNLENLYYYTCGSENLMKAVFKCCSNEGQLSLEARMGCGFGCCMGCSIQTKNGPKRICKEGTIFNSKELLW